MKSYNGDRRLGELNYEYRPAIEEHDQNNMSRCGIHAIIDALRDYGTKSQKADTDLADRWWCFGRALFRRLAIHLVTVSGLSENEKIDWLIERTNLYEPNYRHEIYHLLETAIGNASPAVKERLLEHVLTAPPKTDRNSDELKQRNIYDVNDNYRGWDDDMVVGSLHLTELFEFFHTLRVNGWEGVWQLDQFPFREDVVDNARTSIRLLKAIHRALDNLDEEALAAAQARQDPLAAQRIVQDALLTSMVGA